MSIKTVEVNGNKYMFVNESGNTRNGFYHRSTMYKNEIYKTDNKVNYLNRTWECYQYQTAMKGCVYGLMQNRIERLKADFMKANGYKKMTSKRYTEFECAMNCDSLLNEYRELNKLL